MLPCLVIFVLFGCDLNNTPTSKVEELLSMYQMVDDDIDMDDRVQLLTNVDDLTEMQLDEYHSIVEKQYKSLSYNVKDETVDGDAATVEVQIEVMDYKSAIEKLDSEIDSTTVGITEYNDKKIEVLKAVKDKVTYTILFHVNKNDDGNWELVPLVFTEQQKLLGAY